MTRAEVKEMLISMGVSEPTNENVDAFLNKHQADVQKEKELANKYKADSLKVAELQEQLDAINSQNLSDIEKANKETEKANQRIAELEKAMAIEKRNSELAKLGITENIFGDDGSINFDVLGKVISDKETLAKSQKEKELLDGTPNPTGSNKSKEEKSDVDILAETVGKQIASENQMTNSVLANYITK